MLKSKKFDNRKNGNIQFVMSVETKDVYAKSAFSTLRPAISFIVVPLGFIFEFVVEAPFLILLTVDNILRKKR